MGAPTGRTVLGCSRRREPYRLLRADALSVLDPLHDRRVSGGRYTIGETLLDALGGGGRYAMTDDLKDTTIGEAVVEGWAKVKLPPRMTGLPMVVWITENDGCPHDVRVKVSTLHGGGGSCNGVIEFDEVKPRPQQLQPANGLDRPPQPLRRDDQDDPAAGGSPALTPAWPR